MKRVVEFRGKKRTTLQPINLDMFNESEKEVEWVYGSFSNGIDGKGAYIMPYCYTAGLIAISEDVDEDGEDVIEYGTDVFLGGWIQVIPESVGEFAGLYDNTNFSDLPEREKESWLKNNAESEWKGNKIFEGDIVNHSGTIKIIEFYEGSFIAKQGGCAQSEQSLINFAPCRTFEIIGNSFDNQELLDNL